MLIELLPVIPHFNNHRIGTGSIISPFFEECLSRFASPVVTLCHRFRFTRLDRFHGSAILRRDGLFAETPRRVRHTGPHRVLASRRSVISLGKVRARSTSSANNRSVRSQTVSESRRRFVDVAVVGLTVSDWAAVTWRLPVSVALFQSLEELRSSVLQAGKEHSLVVHIVTSTVSGKTGGVDFFAGHVSLAPVKAWN